MSLKIAFDFDGVCTDLSFVHEQNTNEVEYLYSPFSISISQPRKGILELASVFGLFAELSIFTSRPVEYEVYIKNWLSKNKLLSFFKNILCCGDTAKSEMMKQHEITLLIDDKLKHLGALSENLKGILWDKQTWIELSKEIFNSLITNSNASLKTKTEMVLNDVEYLTDLGSSPVFILKFTDKTKLKLRVCSNSETKQRVINFLEITSINNYNHVSRFVDSNGLAILKTFIEGNLISSFNQSDRLIYISKAGSALAKLHAIKIDKSISKLKFHMNDKNESLLVFSADNYNMIVTEKKEVAFIDLEACNSGSRWIDFIWSENLLCENEQEKRAFSEGYFAVYKGKIATEEEMRIAKLNYKLWLTYQLQNSKLSHSNNIEKLKIIDNTFHQIWSN